MHIQITIQGGRLPLNDDDFDACVAIGEVCKSKGWHFTSTAVADPPPAGVGATDALRRYGVAAAPPSRPRRMPRPS